MLLHHGRNELGGGPRPRFAFTAEGRLVSAVGRATYAFMCLRWEALWTYGALMGTTHPTDRLARAEPAVLALRLQAAARDAPEALRAELGDWVDAFAACVDAHTDTLRSHPGADGLWSLPTDTPERLILSEGPAELLDGAERFEALALVGQRLRARLLG